MVVGVIQHLMVAVLMAGQLQQVLICLVVHVIHCPMDVARMVIHLQGRQI